MVFDERNQARTSFKNDYIVGARKSNQTVLSGNFGESREGLDAAIMS